MQRRQNGRSHDIEREALISDEDSPSFPVSNSRDDEQTGEGWGTAPSHSSVPHPQSNGAGPLSHHHGKGEQVNEVHVTTLHPSSQEQASNGNGAIRRMLHPSSQVQASSGAGALDREDPEHQRNFLLSSSGSYLREYVVYPERWYILGVFSLTAAIQCWGWNTWGPIEDSAAAVFGWSEGDLALLANWGNITYLASAFFFSWLLHTKGLRWSMLITLGLMVLGTGVRCLPVPTKSMIWIANIGQILIGLAGPILMAGVTTVSAVWFPSNERVSATAIGSCFVFLGNAMSFSIGSHIVQDIYPLHTNKSTVSPLLHEEKNMFKVYKEGNYDPSDVRECLQEIKILLLIQFALTSLFMVAVMIYFPAAPATSPTASAAVKREDMKPGFLKLVKNKSFWIPALAYSMSTGCFSSWGTQMVSIFNNNIDQDTCGWIGFYSNIAAGIGCVTFARFVDCLGGKLKAVLLGLILGMFAACLWALLLSNDYIPFSTVSMYLSVILFTSFVNSSVPLFYEVTIEGSFPVGEETTTMFLTWLCNIPAFLFLVLPMFPSVSSDFGDWMNWMMLGAVAICIPLILLYKEQYNRLSFDQAHPDEEVEEDNDNDAGLPTNMPGASIQS